MGSRGGGEKRGKNRAIVDERSSFQDTPFERVSLCCRITDIFSFSELKRPYIDSDYRYWLAFTSAMLGGYAFDWLAFVLILIISLSKRKEGKISSRFEISMLISLLVLAGASYIIANHPSGPDVGFYVKALTGFAQAPLNFYLNYAPYTYPPLQLYLSVIPYLLGLSPFNSLWFVSVVANLASGLLLYLLLGRGLKGLVGAGLLLFNPYYAQYSIVNLTSEALIAPFFLSALLFFRKRDGASGLFLGVSALAKQEALYPAFALFVKRLFENRPRSVKFLVSALLAFVLLSLPFLLFTPIQYLSIITQRPFGAQSLSFGGTSGGPAAFSTFWSVLNWASGVTAMNFNAIQAARPFVWVVLMALVVFVIFRRDLSSSHTSVLGYIPYILASDFGGGWYLIVFIPMLIPVYLDQTLNRSERAASLFMLLAMLPYRLADNYSSVTGSSPPYVFGDALLGLASLYFIILAVRRSLNPEEWKGEA